MRTFGGVTLGILLPLIIIPIVLVGGFAYYRRRIAALRIGSSTSETNRDLPGGRLTSETLRRLPHPPWRVVFEISPKVFDRVDHVVIGPFGIIALTTVVADRPLEPVGDDSLAVASAALARSEVDELTRRVGLRCEHSARVFWGTPRPEMPAGRPGRDGTVDVEGQRLDRWLQALPPGPLAASQVDLAWQAVVTGIGRPDPLV